MNSVLTRVRLILVAGVLLAIAAVIALAAAGDVPQAMASSSVDKRLKKLKQRVATLQQQVDALQMRQGPQGPQGPQGGQGAQGQPGAPGCQGSDADDVMVSAGAVCIDRYEASVWSQPNGGTQLTTEAQVDAACPDNGQPMGGADCQAFYARSVAGVEPARDITWFQAQQALANSGKRLPTNAEWQQAVSGTPDSGDCNVAGLSVANTGANANCVSRFGAFDMVGNLVEWVADWDEQADGCAAWPPAFGSDSTCFGDGTPSRFPGALVRGGEYDVFDAGVPQLAGPFAVRALNEPSDRDTYIGFRGAR